MHLFHKNVGTDEATTHASTPDAMRSLAALESLLESVRTKIRTLKALPPDAQLGFLFLQDLEALRRDELMVLFSIREVRSRLRAQ